MNETVTMNRVNPDSSHEPQDNSETRTIDTVKCDGTDTGSNQQTYPDTYSSTENPLMFATTGFEKHFLSFGSSSEITFSIPGF